MTEYQFSKEEIEAIKKEYREERTMHGSNEPVILDDKTAEIILRSQKSHDDYINSVHESHDMSEWRTEIIAPVGTPRFYNFRECEICSGAQYYHAAGKFIDGELKRKCIVE